MPDEECPICFEPLNNLVCTTICTHRFHYNCIYNCIAKTNLCPCCRRENPVPQILEEIKFYNENFDKIKFYLPNDANSITNHIQRLLEFRENMGTTIDRYEMFKKHQREMDCHIQRMIVRIEELNSLPVNEVKKEENIQKGMKLKVAELQTICRNRKLRGFSNKRKTDLIAFMDQNGVIF